MNYPDCPLPPVSGKRLTVLHANIPTMVGQVTSELAKASINIASMVNKSRGLFAYTVLDLDQDVPSSTLDTLNALPDVYRVRLLG